MFDFIVFVFCSGTCAYDVQTHQYGWAVWMGFIALGSLVKYAMREWR